MGEIADDMVNGASCSHCGMYFKQDHGYPVLCHSCFDGQTTGARAGLQQATEKMERYSMKYCAFSEAVTVAGLMPVHCQSIHWQIRGGTHHKIVNVWPHSTKGFRFQADCQKSRFGNLQQAIDLAGPPLDPVVEEAPAPWEESQSKTAPEHVGLIRWLWRVLW